MGLWLILCNRSGSVVGSTLSETAEWTSAGGPWTPHAESKAVHFQIHLFSSAVIKKADGGKCQILELRCGVAEQTGWFAESVIQKYGSVQDLIVDTHQVHTKGSICEIWQHLALKKLFANKWFPDNESLNIWFYTPDQTNPPLEPSCRPLAECIDGQSF